MLDDAEYLRWIKSSRGAVNSAKGDLERGDYNWACFKAQQSAEFAVKAVLHGLGLPVYGHSVSALLTKAPKDLQVNEKIMQEAKTLDKYYVPTRYPNAWAEGTPMDYYTKSDAQEAIKCAEDIINWAEALWRSLKEERN
jgi:HEPN domain-containing protein